MVQSIKTFNPKLPRLKKSEKATLDLLIQAAKLIAPIFDEQKNYKQPGANFYPHNISKREIEKAAKSNSDILSPYTVVEKVKGKLVAVPYHVKYAKQLSAVVEKILGAADITENKEFAKRLTIQARALQDGSYLDADVAWMTMKPYVIDFLIGPAERYEDKLFHVKTAFQAWVGVMDIEATKQLTKYKQMILSSRRKAMMPSERVDFYGKVQVRVDDIVVFGGRIAITCPVGVSLPNDTSLIERYGSEITIFNQTNDLRHERNWAVFNKLFSPEFRKEFSSEDLREGSVSSTALHELAHTYLTYRGAEARLQDLFPIIDELAATVMGIKVCGSLLLKDIVTQKQLTSMMLAYMCRSLNSIIYEKTNVSRYHYLMGGVIFINYLLESGAVREIEGISFPNFMKMFVSLDQLASMLERLLSSGTRKDAESFIKRYSNLKPLERFNK